jgi:tRNA G18 (ribose-2'-O)-methylase SpoU
MAEENRQLVLVIHNVRSAMNVGSMFRTADGLGVDMIYLTGYTPYPESEHDERLPHIGRRTGQQIHKTALGAEDFVHWEHIGDIKTCLSSLKKRGFEMVALEQANDAVAIDDFQTGKDIALIVGNEVTGLESDVLELADVKLHIPMTGRKESFNVAVAAAIALYRLSRL